MRDIMQKYIEDGTRVLDRMEQDSLCANTVSHELLMELVRKNQDILDPAPDGADRVVLVPETGMLELSGLRVEIIQATLRANP